MKRLLRSLRPTWAATKRVAEGPEPLIEFKESPKAGLNLFYIIDIVISKLDII